MYLEGFIGLLCLFGTSYAIGSHPDVAQLDDSNFDSVAGAAPLMLIEFYAPWCGHCKRLAPEYEKAAEKLAKASIPLAKVDCTEAESVCQRFGVSGYPTLKIFRDGEVAKDYEGPREADGIVRTMMVEGGPSAKELSTLGEFDQFISDFDHSIVGFFPDAESAQAKAFLKMADSLKADLRFAHVLGEEIVNKFDQFAGDVVVFRPQRLASKLEENVFECEDKKTWTAMKTCVQKNLHGAVGHRQTSNIGDFINPLVNVYYAVDYIRNPKGSNYWRNRVLKVAKGFADKRVNFAVSSWDDFGTELEDFGEKPLASDAKPLVTAKNIKGEKFIMSDDFSIDNLNKFVGEFLDNKLEPYLKSEEVPEQEEGKPTVLVAKNFNEFVNDEKDALLEFYAPWCGHCKKLAPIYDELAEKLQGEDVVIGKMDATANDVSPDFEVRGFPTLFWKPAGKPAIKYEGGRELDDFIKYIAKHSTNELNKYTRSGKKRKAPKKEEL